MPKLLWVLAPLAVVGAWLLVLAWRGRLPSRPALNVLFSLLLLAYLAGTAGLGIFWVANQQLPVFDWHYLFGYATVALLVVHLGFNLRIVWMQLRRAWARRASSGEETRPSETGTTPLEARAGRLAAARPPGIGTPGRRPLLGIAGAGALALAGGLGYLLGMRHGRTELHLGDVSAAMPHAPEGATAARGAAAPAAATPAATGTGTGADPRAWAVVERFHAFSGHSRTRVLRHAASTDWGDGPPPFKRYAGAERLALPPPRRTAAASSTAAVRTVDLARLGTWLWHTAGISDERGGLVLRTSPSSGALFATELYVLAREVAGLAPGAWHYDAERHALERLPPLAADAPGTGGPDDLARRLAACGPLELPADCPAVIVASAVFARSGRKYGDRTYRYVVADLGHALENLRRATRADGGHAAQLLPRFDDFAVAGALGMDTRTEGVLAVVAVDGDSAGDAGGRSGGVVGASPGTVTAALAEPGRWTTALPTGGDTGRIGLTEGIQAATALRSLAGADSPGAAGARPLGAAPRASAPAVTPTASAPSTASPAVAAAARAEPATASQPGPASPTELPLPFLSAAVAGRLADPLALIARRRSHRRFAARPLPLQALADVLEAMTGTAPVLSGAVRIDVVTAAVEGLAPASWRVQPVRREGRGTLLLQRQVLHGETLRRKARAAALDQDVIGDAAAVFVLSLDVAALRADGAGAARGYRHGFIEAGLVGERIYLAAGALGLATCAVGAFYDDEAAALVGQDPAREWAVHFAGLGWPA